MTHNETARLDGDEEEFRLRNRTGDKPQTRQCRICGDIAERMPDWLCLECSAHYRHSDPYEEPARFRSGAPAGWRQSGQCSYYLEAGWLRCVRTAGHAGSHTPDPEAASHAG